MSSILKLSFPLSYQTEISLMYQSRTLQGVIGPLPLQVVVRQASQLVIDEG
jgi:hypothetical protein